MKGMHRSALILTLTALFCGTGPAACQPRPRPDTGPQPVSDAYRQAMARWRADRLAGLKRDGGWLQLAGFAYLKDGPQQFGSAADGDVVLAARAPARIGTLTVSGQQVRLQVAPGVACTLDGQLVRERELKTDGDGARPADRFRVGDFLFAVIVRGGRLALRWWDRQSDTLRRFTGIRSFPLDARYRVQARFEPYAAPRQVELQTVIQTTVKAQVPGRVLFELYGQTFQLEPLAEPGDSGFFFVFGDETNGRETYGGGRFLATDLPKDGRLVLDFNKATNPPCAFTHFATCPLPRRENRLPVPIPAGERRYVKPGPAGGSQGHGLDGGGAGDAHAR